MEEFLKIESDQKWVLYVQEKIQKNDLKFLNLSCNFYSLSFKKDFIPKNIQHIEMLFSIKEIEYFNAGAFLDPVTLHTFELSPNLKSLNVSGKIPLNSSVLLGMKNHCFLFNLELEYPNLTELDLSSF
jgi:hypothetical protein